jgi:hypothetical protein
LDLGRWILIQRRRTCSSGGTVASEGRRRRPAVSSGGTRRRPQSRAPGHGSMRGRHLRAAREAARRLRAAAPTETRRSGLASRRPAAWQGGEDQRGFYGVAGARDRIQLHETAPYLLAQLREYSLSTKRRRRREPEGGGARVSARAWRKRWRASRVGSPRGGGRLIKAWEPALACGPRGGACSSRTQAAVQSDSKTSPARGRRGGEDDQWGPLVSGTGAEAGSGCGRKLDGPQAQAGWLAQLLRGAALNAPRARAAACWACCWATAWLERAASWLLGWE